MADSDIKISALSNGTLTTGSLFVAADENSGTPSGYSSGKHSAGDMGLGILGQFQYTQQLQTTAKTIFGAINELAQGGGGGGGAGVQFIELEYDDQNDVYNLPNNMTVNDINDMMTNGIMPILTVDDADTIFLIKADSFGNLDFIDFCGICNIAQDVYNFQILEGEINETYFSLIYDSEIVTEVSFSNLFEEEFNSRLTKLETTLTAGNTSVTFTNASIKTNSYVEVFSGIFGVDPTNVVVDGANHTCTVTFEAQQSDMSVGLAVMN